MPCFLPISIVIHNKVNRERTTFKIVEMVPGERIRFIEERQVLPTVQ